MWSKRFWILPMLIISSVVLHQLDVLHLGYLYIKSHDMKYTVLSMDYYPKDGDLFTTSETVTPGYNYEEGIISLNPDYNKLLDNDLNEIAVNREKIDSIEYEDLAFYAGPYRVYLKCTPTWTSSANLNCTISMERNCFTKRRERSSGYAIVSSSKAGHAGSCLIIK